MAAPEQNPIEVREVFRHGDQPFTVRDLIDAAQVRGELAEPLQNFRQILAAENNADAAGLDSRDDAIDSAAEQFRYQHELITAEETERWLDERRLTLGDFSSYFVRHYWGENAASDDGGSAAVDHLSAPGEERALFTIELILSGELDRMAARSSWRVAARAAAKEPLDPQVLALAEASFRERHGLAAGDEADWLGALGRDQNWLRAQLELEASYDRVCTALLTREARAHEIAALRLPLTNFEVETIEFDSLDAAREGLLCVRQDGMTMEEVANEGRYPYRHTDVLLEDVPEDLQQKFLSVTPGEVLEPITHGEGFHLCRVIAKTEPQLDDPNVKARAEDRILDRHFDELTAKYVQWKSVPA